VTQRTRHHIKLVGSLCVVVLLGLALFAATRRFFTHEMFRRIVTRPIPKSVQHIKTDSHGQKYEQIRIVQFDISKEDLLKTVASASFKRLAYAKYSRGRVRYGPSDVFITSLSLYRSEGQKPKWLDLEHWTDFVAYIVEQEEPNTRYSVRIMLYSEPLGRACVIEREMRGPWGGGPFRVTDPVTGEMPSSSPQQPGERWLGPPELQPE